MRAISYRILLLLGGVWKFGSEQNFLGPPVSKIGLKQPPMALLPCPSLCSAQLLLQINVAWIVKYRFEGVPVISLPCMSTYLSSVQRPTLFLNYLLDAIQTPQLWHSIPGTWIYYFTRNFANRIKTTDFNIRSLGNHPGLYYCNHIDF